MSEQTEKNRLLQVKPSNIEGNKDNPRLLFLKENLELQQSISRRGILVPLIIHKKKGSQKKWILLDGERRLNCAKNLRLKTVPANEIEPPNRLQNILLMFNIHNVRKDWELVPTALKLEVLLRILPKRGETSNAELAKITGMSTIRVAECRRILKFDKKYLELALTHDPKKRIGGDFLSQLGAALEKLENYPEITREYSKDKIIEIMIQKFRDGTIINPTNEFRTLRKILASDKKGVEKKLIIQKVKDYIKSKPVVKSGQVKKKSMTMNQLFEETSYTAYKEDEIIKTATKLEEILRKFDSRKAKKVNELTRSLDKLAIRIDKIIDQLER